jgi:phenylalanyl-tRNA synthetase beta chain
LHIAPSPYWIQHCLGSAGIRSISNVVDISNFVMLEYGNPMHTFDYDTLQGHGVIVRRAKDGEKIVTLDEQERELNSENLFICDANDRPICVAGVMGGLNTEITDDTKNVLLETAAFNHVSIRRTSRALGLHSEASQRYEKGVNIALLDEVSRRTIQLLAEYCGGKPVAGSIDRNVFVEEKNVVKLRPASVNVVLGTNFTEDEILSCMQKLKFTYTKDGDGYLVEIPNYRQDIFVEVDLIEEVARLQGFDKIPTTLPYGAMTEGKRTPKQRFLENVKAAMVRLGGNEIINYGFISPREWDRLSLPEDDKLRDVVKILNPLNEEQSIMRTSLLPGVLKTASRNNARRNNDLLIFEVGAVFIPQGDELPNEVNTLAVLGCGQASKNWYSAGDNFDFFRMKGMLEALLSDCRVADATFKPCRDLPYMHPGRTAALYLGDDYAGYIGELHPQAQANYEIKQRSVVLEINLDVLFEHVGEISQYQSLPKFPAAVRDIAVVLDKKVSAADLEAAIAKAGGKHLVDISLFDVYENISLGLGRRSLAYNLTFQCPDRTLTVEEVNEAFEDILIAVQELGGELRS